MEFITKVTSRKFITAVLGVTIGAAMVFGVDEETAVSIAGAVLTLISVVSYIVVEGKVDREALTNTIDAVEETSRKLFCEGEK